MMKQPRVIALLMLITVLAWTDRLTAQRSDSPDERAIRENAEAFVRAFNAGDGLAVANLWTENGQLVLDAETTLEGREAIAAEYNAFLQENSGAKIRVAIKSIRLLGPNLAIEKGTSQISPDGDSDAVLDDYTLIHVKQDGKWLIATANAVQKVQPVDWRKQVEFLVGAWHAEKENWRMEATVKWTKNKSFLLREFTVSEGDQEIRSGHQIIGWDPREELVVTWMFGADGGHGQGYWNYQDDGWSETIAGTTGDGERFESTNVFTVLSDEELLWHSVDRSIEGYPLEDTPQVRIVRVKK